MAVADVAALTDQQLRAELDACQRTIDAAYWAFTRQARGRPPSLVVPEAYQRRAELQAERERRRVSHPPSPASARRRRGARQPSPAPGPGADSEAT